MHTERYRRYLERNERKDKGRYYKTQKKEILWSLGKREWYNKEWKGRKRELRRILRDLKKERINKEDYVRKRKEYKE